MSIRRRSVVRIINAQNPLANRTGVVRSISKTNATFIVAVDSADFLRIATTDVDPNEIVTSFRADELALEASVSVDQVAQIQQDAIAFTTKRDADRKAMEERTRQAKIDRYLAERRTPATQYVRDPNSDARRIEYGEQRDGFVRAYITTYVEPVTDAAWNPAPKVGINWSAFGTVSPEETIAFAQQLLVAAGEAIAIRAKLEADAGITI